MRFARSCIIDALKNTTRIVEEQISGINDFHVARKAFEQLETNFMFQILDLTREGGLSYEQSLRCSPVMLFLSDHQEIPQLSLHRSP
jgi:hypothetical protein